MVKWPIYGSNFNTRDYCSLQMVLSDLEAIIRITLKDRLDISEADYKVGSFSSGLTNQRLNTAQHTELFCCSRNPWFLWSGIRSWICESSLGVDGVQTDLRAAGWHIFLLLMTTHILKQESLAATYGAGISNACVVDIGATTTSIACVDEGLVLPDTRYLWFSLSCPFLMFPNSL